MKIAIRADASSRIGLGHVMRCLSLADSLKQRGADVVFLCREFAGHAGPIISARGFNVHLLPRGQRQAAPPPAHAGWLDAGIDEDAAHCKAFLQSRVDGLVVDHYALDHRWQTMMRSLTNWIAVIDDLADRSHDADILLDQNHFSASPNRYARRVPPHCRCLLGPTFALVHESFCRTASTVSIRNKLRSVLVFFGGGDQANLTAKALRELSGFPLALDVVIGAANPHRSQIESLCQKQNAALHVQTEQMAARMAAADLFVGAGGTTHWERCILALPAITIATASNQETVSEQLADKGTCLYLGPAAQLPQGAIAAAVRRLLNNPDDIESLSRSSRAIVPDGNGANRVADILINNRSFS